jgi:hypothetical protein
VGFGFHGFKRSLIGSKLAGNEAGIQILHSANVWFVYEFWDNVSSSAKDKKPNQHVGDIWVTKKCYREESTSMPQNARSWNRTFV